MYRNLCGRLLLSFCLFFLFIAIAHADFTCDVKQQTSAGHTKALNHALGCLNKFPFFEEKITILKKRAGKFAQRDPVDITI